MHASLQGLLIRQRRLERNWSQSGLCQGICAVSYLSKIEQGRAEGSREILDLLFARLGIAWREDPAFCRESQRWFDGCYDRLFSLEDMSQEQKDLREAGDQYRDTPFFLDFLLLSGVVQNRLPPEAEAFVPAMDHRQYGLYLFLSGREEELLRGYANGFYLFQAGQRAYQQGDYSRAVALLLRAWDLACREGAPCLMLHCRLLLGNCYSDLGQFSQMQAHYQAATRLARALGDEEALTDIAYNLASTELELGRTQEAYLHFLEHPQSGAMYFHKLAICCERLGMPQEARDNLDQALAAVPDRVVDKKLLARMCWLIEYRLDHPGYLRDQAYGKALERCVRELAEKLPMGYARFHLPWLEEWYTANRQYKQAYELRKKFS